MVIDMHKYTELFFDECQKIIDLGFYDDIKDNDYNLELKCNLGNTLGSCINNSYIEKYNGHFEVCHSYTIVLNKDYALIENERLVRQTIMHEIIHSLPKCMSHSGRWLEIAEYINAKLDYNISKYTVAVKYAKYLQETEKELQEFLMYDMI